TAMLMSILCLALAAALFAEGSPKVEASLPSPKDPFKLYNQGVDLMQKGSFAKAQARFEEALAVKEDFAEAHNNLGYSLRKQGAAHYDEALRHYDRAIELNPQLAAAYEYRGVLHVLRGEEDAAKADLAKLTGLDRKMADELLQVIASREEPKGDNGLAAKWVKP